MKYAKGLEAAGIPERALMAAVSLQVPAFAGAANSTASWVAGFQRGHTAGLLLAGTTGTGKTLLASIAAATLLANGLAVRFSDFGRFLAELQTQCFSKDADTDEVQFLDGVAKQHDCLVLDDVGAERAGASNGGFAASILSGLLDRFIEERGALLVTTNLSVKDLGGRYGARVVSRLHEALAADRGGGVLIMAGEDQRLSLAGVAQ